MAKHKYNLKKDKKDKRDYSFKDIVKITEIPDSINIIDRMPVIYDQGDIGSCQSFASGSIKEALDNCKYESSKLFIYYNAREDKNQDTGTTLREVCDSLKKYGAAENEYWKYDTDKFPEQPPAAAYTNGELHTITSYHRVKNISEMQQALASGYPILVGVKVYESFEAEACMNTGIILEPSGELLGGHAMVICAYYKTEKAKQSLLARVIGKFTGSESSAGYFILRNSWGTDVGLADDKGYFKITFENLKKILMDAWVITK